MVVEMIVCDWNGFEGHDLPAGRVGAVAQDDCAAARRSFDCGILARGRVSLSTLSRVQGLSRFSVNRQSPDPFPASNCATFLPLESLRTQIFNLSPSSS